MIRGILLPEEERRKHVLDNIKMPERSREWSNRVRRWNRPMDFDQRLQWLHTNVASGNENGPEQFIFFLELADGYGLRHHFRAGPLDFDKEKYTSTLKDYWPTWKQKSLLAKKAFALLCTEFFADRGENHSRYVLTLPFEEPLFSKLLWFFRLLGGNGGYDNLRPADTEGLDKDKSEHYVRTANEFAKRFVGQAWEMLNGYWYTCWETDSPRRSVALPHLREIVILVRHLGLLSRITRGQFAPAPDIFKRMVELALEDEVPFPPEFGFEGDPVDAGPLLEPLIREGSGNDLAEALYIARLNVMAAHENRQKNHKFHLLKE